MGSEEPNAIFPTKACSFGAFLGAFNWIKNDVPESEKRQVGKKSEKYHSSFS